MGAAGAPTSWFPHRHRRADGVTGPALLIGSVPSVQLRCESLHECGPNHLGTGPGDEGDEGGGVKVVLIRNDDDNEGEKEEERCCFTW